MKKNSLIPLPEKPKPECPNRAKHILVYTATGAGILLLLITGGKIWLTQTASGHRATEGLIRHLTDGEVQIDHLDGDIFTDIRAEGVQLADKNGVWLKIQDVHLSWNALALIRSHVDINAVTARRIQIFRSPQSESKSSGDGPKIDIASLRVSRIDIAKDAFGQEAHLTLEGRLSYTNAKNFTADIRARQENDSGQYRVNLRMKHGWPEGDAHIRETGAGFAGALAGMPDIGAVNLDLTARTKDKKDALQLHFTAGKLKLDTTGQVDLKAETMALNFSAASPEMHPRKDLSWASFRAEGTAEGHFSAPQVRATLDLQGLTHGTTQIGRTEMQVSTAQKRVVLTGKISGIDLPGDEDHVLGAAPLTLHADVDFARKSMPVRFQAEHPLFRLTGAGQLQNTNFQADLYMPKLAPLAKLGGVDMQGHTRLHLEMNENGDIRQFHASGKLAAEGANLAGRVLGPNSRIEADYILSPTTSRLTATLDGRGLLTRIEGTDQDGEAKYQAKIQIRDASRFSDMLAGNASMVANLTGPMDKLHLSVRGGGNIGAKQAPRDRIDLVASADDITHQPRAKIRLSGWFDNSPLTLAASVRQESGATAIQIGEAAWRSLTAGGSLMLTKGVPQGEIYVAIKDLSDISDFTDTPLAGALQAKLQTNPTGDFGFNATVSNFVSGDTGVKSTTLSGTLQQLKSGRRMNATLKAKGVTAAGMHGDVSAEVYGPLDNIGAAIKADFTTSAGQLELTSQLQYAAGPDQRLQFESLRAKWNGKILELAQPTEIRMTESGITTDLVITDHTKTRLEIDGRIPQKEGQSFALRVTGRANLGKWTDMLNAQGQSLQGSADIYARVSGPLSAPNIVGNAHLKDGRFYDVGSGLRLHDISANVLADGSEVRLKTFSAKAHGGTITGSGTITTQGTFPVNLIFHARNARPFSRDGFMISMDGDVAITGGLKDALKVNGKLKIDRGEIRLPDKMPPSIATLDVRRHGTKEPPKPAASRLALNISITSPGQFFVRGHGLDAELAGTISIDGNSSQPQLHGKLEMRHGTYSMAGTSLNFTSGDIDFEGSNSSGEIDPALDFTATSETSSVTATLNITGTARKPQIDLSSSPTMPQDEILSQLLFQQSMDQLSPLQLAQIAQALVSLSGLDGGINPVEIARSSLKLDRLQFSSTPDSTGSDASDTTVEAGKYVLHNVYVGAKQSLSGGTRAQVQVDINRHFKIEGSIATDSGSSAVPTTTTQDTGDTVGLSYQFEY